METVAIKKCLEIEGQVRCLPQESPFRFVEWRKALLNHERLKHHDEILLSAPVLEVIQPETQP